MIPRRPHRQEDSVDSWLMSYADMITLLLCFFIIFVSVSQPRKEQLEAITDGMAGKFGTVDLSTPFQGAYASLEAVIEKHSLFKDTAIEKTRTSIDMEMATGRFFAPDSADVLPDMTEVLNEMVASMKKLDFIDYRITVESYTSDAQVKNPLFVSNWELSAARAATLVRVFIAGGIAPDHLKAVAYADTHPKVPNRDGSGRAILENRRLNERVVIKLERIL